MFEETYGKLFKSVYSSSHHETGALGPANVHGRVEG
jgi:hypothetical protein